MIDLATESLLTFGQASKLFPTRPHAATFWRWHKHGLKDQRGDVVRLEIARVGGRVYTSREALQRFSERLSGGDTATSTVRTPGQRRRASERAARELEKAGI